MPWMCLEKCGQNNTYIIDSLKDIIEHKEELTGVSFEMYELGPGSKFIKENITSVGSVLKGIDLETYAMISSCIMCDNATCCYPDDFLLWLRELFSNPDPFINAAMQEIQDTDFTGYNVDFEPTATATPEDAQKFAEFLTQFAASLHQIDKKLTVDIASWNPIWNWTLISNSQVDRMFLMNTYTGNFTWFQHFFEEAIKTIDINKLGIGLESINPNTNLPFSNNDLQQRFDLILNNNIQEIDIWDAPVPDNFWPFIDQFINSNNH